MATSKLLPETKRQRSSQELCSAERVDLRSRTAILQKLLAVLLAVLAGGHFDCAKIARPDQGFRVEAMGLEPRTS